MDFSPLDAPRGASPEAHETPGADALILEDEAGARGEGSGLRRVPRRRWLASGALALAALAVLVIVLAESSSPTRAARGAGVPAGETTATVMRRTLSESATVDGTLGYGGELEVYDRLAGTYTWLPAVGAHIHRGGMLFRLDEKPVVLMYGSVPAYRALKEGVSAGVDVAELNANLIDLGYDPYGAIADRKSFSAATAEAVRRWQEAEGLPQTGEVELGRIAFAPGAQRVTAVHVSLGQDPPGASPSEPQSGRSSEPRSGQPGSTAPGELSEPPSSGGSTPESRSRGSKAHSKSSKSHEPSGGRLPRKRASKTSLPSSSHEADKTPRREEAGGNPSSKGGNQAAGGAPAASGGEAVLSTTSTQQIVKLKVKPEQQQLAHVGERVTVLLPGGGTVPGRITSVGTVASSSTESPGGERGGGESGETTIAVTVTLDRRVAHLDQAPVSVELVKSIRREVLTVPATALIGTAGGGYAIEALESGRRTVVPVSPGMFSGGYVQVEGPRVHEGMTVIESE